MADRMTKAQRSYTMSRIRSSGNETTEKRFVALLKSAGIKGWRRHAKLAGRPDFIFPRARVAVFLDGCFWHGCPRCCRTPKTNPAYWTDKIRKNALRDREVSSSLRSAGWRVVRLWEHSIREKAEGRSSPGHGRQRRTANAHWPSAKRPLYLEEVAFVARG